MSQDGKLYARQFTLMVMRFVSCAEYYFESLMSDIFGDVRVLHVLVQFCLAHTDEVL